MDYSLLTTINLEAIPDAGARQAIRGLLNLIEELAAENRALRGEVQQLRDEIRRLQGEQGKPDIKANTPKPPSPPGNSGTYSSERERRTPQRWTKRPRNDTLHIDREEVLGLDPATLAALPADAEFKGYQDVVVQDIVFTTDTVRFRKATYYSPGEARTYVAPLPPGYTGQFGPGLKALSLVLYFGAQVSEPKLLELLHTVGVQISAGHLSHLLIHDQCDQAAFHAERQAVVEAGLGSSPWQHLDDTATRVNGQNQHCHILCNPFYTAYTTTAAKDRQTILDVLRNGRPRTFLWNAEAEHLLDPVGLSRATRAQLATLPPAQFLDEPTLTGWLAEHLPHLGPQQRKWILDATAIAAYHAEAVGPVVQLLVCDDAPQFTGVTAELALCWVHEGRHYQKLLPYVPAHRRLLEEFRTRFWDYYRELLAYRQAPTAAEAERLTAQFATLFATTTGYVALDDRIAKTRAKQAELLRVLAHPEIPLHNNPAELGARQRVRKRDVSFGPRTAAGAQAWDTFMTLAATAKQLGVNFYAYLHDRITRAERLPGLDTLITAWAQQLDLGASWRTT
jgi:hypothetical protein